MSGKIANEFFLIYFLEMEKEEDEETAYRNFISIQTSALHVKPTYVECCRLVELLYIQQFSTLLTRYKEGKGGEKIAFSTKKEEFI